MLVLSLVGAGITAYLTVEHGRGGVPVCVLGEGCGVIARSAYAHIGPIPSAAFGLLGYLVLAVLFTLRLMRPPEDFDRVLVRVTFGMAAFGFLISAWLTYVALVELRATCTWCLASAIDLTLLTALTAFAFAADRRALAGEDERSA